jgi:hypothetical protein
MSQGTAESLSSMGTSEAGDSFAWYERVMRRMLTRRYDQSALVLSSSADSRQQAIPDLSRKSVVGYSGAGVSVAARVFKTPQFGYWYLASESLPTMIPLHSKHSKEEREDARNVSVLEQVYALAESNQVRRAAAKIMEYTDGLLLTGQFDVCGRLLDSVDFPRLSKYPTLLVAFLGITLGAKDKLGWSRDAFWSKVRIALSRELGPGRAENILRRFQ